MGYSPISFQAMARLCYGLAAVDFPGAAWEKSHTFAEDGFYLMILREFSPLVEIHSSGKRNTRREPPTSPESRIVA
ncbi:MAG: hypothetical protein U1F68_04795 [Gammaproteobacteria bacterium]